MTLQDGYREESTDTDTDTEAVAVVAMAGRLPGAATIEEFWQNLRDGVETIRFFTDDELAAAGVGRRERESRNYVPAKGVLDDIAGFDAPYFSMSPREAALIDPQQRLFLEICVELLERAGVWADQARERMSVYAGVSKNTYLFLNLLTHPELRESPGALQTLGANDKDYLATRVSHKLGLRGPSLTVQTACSSSAVAVHLACQSLLSGESDYAIAGGVAVDVPHHAGYHYEQGGIFSPDGHCRPFDADARGTVFSQGAGVVLLRRLSDAVADGDVVQAVILGSAVNNDGADRAGFTAPSVDGQAAVIVEALAAAGVDASTIGYVEAHGTGTALGDPIEVEALRRAFSVWTQEKGFCRIGSVKSNLGHLNAASGVIGLIKTVLALRHGEIPATLHYRRANPVIPFEQTPFVVASEHLPWPRNADGTRRAGVSSFGIGGTNAHLVLESAPERDPATPVDGPQLIPLSANTSTALSAVASRLSEALSRRADLRLADIATTHQSGRRRLAHRAFAVAATHEEAVAALAAVAARPSVRPATGTSSAVFLFPGQGVQYPGLARDLYAREPVFRAQLDECGAVLAGLGAFDPRTVFDGSADVDLERTVVAQPLLFAVEYALAELWRAWGIEPAALLGHSLGEISAAAVGGVLDRDDALRLVAERARLTAEAPAGAMFAVAARREDLPDRLPDGFELAAVNADKQIVVSVSEAAADGAAGFFQAMRAPFRRLAGRHAFHSSSMRHAAEQLARFAAGLRPRPPRIPILSNLTGTWLTDGEAVDPGYWERQMRSPVLFHAGAESVLSDPGAVFVEVGPGRTLSRFVRQNAAWSAATHRATASLPDRAEADGGDLRAMLRAVGTLWTCGIEPDWTAVRQGAPARTVVLPTYPFERRRHWIDPLATPRNTPIASAAVPVEPVPVPDTGTGTSTSTSTSTSTENDEALLTARVVAVFETILGAQDVAPDDDFFALGGSSLLGVELVTRLAEATDVALPLSVLFDDPTPAAIAALLADAVDRGLDRALAQTGADSAKDIWLDANMADPGPVADRRAWKNVLLTGATGFLGTFLLHELLQQTDVTVQCLVRCASPEEGRDRLTASLARYGLLADSDTGRIVVVPGDISRDRFGLADAEYRRLADEIDAIYHNGAKVSFLDPYSQIRHTNVKAAREVLALAAAERTKPVFHVSTIAVFDCDNLAGLTIAGEDDDLSGGGGFHGGYDESKWVAERVLDLARARGYPVTVFRPGNIAGDSRTGAVSDGHLVTAMITGCVALGLAPAVDMYVDIVPVDYVSRALVHLSVGPAGMGRNYHLVNPTWIRWPQVVELLRELGYPLKTVPFVQWREAIRDRGALNNPMHVFLPMLDERDLFSGRRYRSERAVEQLAGSGIACPPVDAALLRTYVGRLVDEGKLATPEAARTEAGK